MKYDIPPLSKKVIRETVVPVAKEEPFYGLGVGYLLDSAEADANIAAHVLALRMRLLTPGERVKEAWRAWRNDQLWRLGPDRTTRTYRRSQVPGRPR